MQPCQFAYAFLVASDTLFAGIKKRKAKGEKKGSPSLWKKETKVGHWQRISVFMSTASKRIKELCNFYVRLG